jgi:hypothetical protein
MNFAAWYLTVYVLYQSFELYLRGRSARLGALPPTYWKMPAIFYGIAAAGNLLLAVPLSGLSTVADAAGHQWKVSSIFGACAAVSVVVMGGFALLAFALPRHATPRCFPRRPPVGCCP